MSKNNYTIEELGKMAREINGNAKKVYTRPVVSHKYSKGEWKIRFMNSEEKDDNECDFFIEAQEPKNDIGKIELLMEDFGEHSGYPREQKLADARLMKNAKELHQFAEAFFDMIASDGTSMYLPMLEKVLNDINPKD